MNLINQQCAPLPKNAAPFTLEAENVYVNSLPPDWKIVRSHEPHILTRTFSFQNFSEAMQFVHQVADLAEKANHHPKMVIDYSTVVLELWTHDIEGLSQNDFILATQISLLVD